LIADASFLVCCLFAADFALLPFDPASGRILWHAGLAASVSNAPMTFELDGRQYLVAGAGNMLYAFTLPDD
jgi:alcohol dehydrogenase (cytochrome c)